MSDSKKPGSAKPRSAAARATPGAKAPARTTASTPPQQVSRANAEALAKKDADTQALAEAIPYNANKPLELGRKNAIRPPEGECVQPSTPDVTGSTLSERNPSAKTGRGQPALATDPGAGPLDRVRTDASGQLLTTNQGVPIADNQNSLKAGLRGPTLLEDFILREKITHFDHERIPERIVHARGSGAHGYFEAYQSLAPITRAAPFAEAGK